MPDSCEASLSIIPALAARIAARKEAMSQSSYVASLMAARPGRIRSKICEEALELEQAGHHASLAECAREAADLVFHSLVMVGWSGVCWSDVEAELARRLGLGGLDEKAARAAGKQ